MAIQKAMLLLLLVAVMAAADVPCASVKNHCGAGLHGRKFLGKSRVDTHTSNTNTGNTNSDYAGSITNPPDYDYLLSNIEIFHTWQSETGNGNADTDYPGILNSPDYDYMPPSTVDFDRRYFEVMHIHGEYNGRVEPNPPTGGHDHPPPSTVAFD